MTIGIITFIAGLIIGQISGAVSYHLKMVDDVEACRALVKKAVYRRALREISRNLQNYGKPNLPKERGETRA